MSKRSGEGPPRAGGLRSALEGDHQRLTELLDELVSATESHEIELARGPHLTALRCTLLGHARAEEEAVYAYMYRHTGLRSVVEDCLEEHSEIEVLIEDLRRGGDEEEVFEDLVWALAAALELHLEQERHEIYRLFQGELEPSVDAELAARYVVARDRWQRHLECETQEPENPIPMPR